ncbi:MAG TPA: phosphatase PAP2 family protein [Chitinophagaceae bacterium]|nr:phosphatase PAP2 family protein [Chitinophagaceae bacterium]
MPPRLFTVRLLLTMAAISAAYLLVSWWLIGFKQEQVFLVVLCNVLFFASMATRSFIIAFSVFIIYWIIFDYMKAFPNYRYQPVHIESIYNAEKSIFGITTSGGQKITPNEYWQLHTSKGLDLLAGIFYLCWIPVPLMFGLYLYFKKKTQFYYFAFTFLLVNLLGFVVYYAYPAAPPWYVSKYGFTFHAATPGNTAGLARFDALVHAGIFQSLYAKSSNVFAAMPSLHSSYPVIVFYYAVKNKVGLINIVFATVMVGIWFSAVYTNHHYILDVLAGITCAITGTWLFTLVRKKWFPEKEVSGLTAAAVNG